MDPRQQQIFISTDLEFDGGNPRIHSMRSIGAVAYREDGKELGRFYMNVRPLPGREPDIRTTRSFWEKPEHANALAALEPDQHEAEEAMHAYVDWVQSFTGKPALVAYPLAVEKGWLDAYFKLFNIESPFEDEICMSAMATEAMKLLGPDDPTPDKIWVSDLPYTHIAIDDAANQGDSFMKMRAWMLQRLKDLEGLSHG